MGGGSNLYRGVSLRAPAASFEQVRDGRRLWPRVYTRASLEPYYRRAEQMLKVVQLRWSDADAPHWQPTTKRDLVFAEGAQRIGATAVPLRLADQNDANEGWWTQGQRFEGRQTLTKNYLQLTLQNGVEVWTSCSVDQIEPDGEETYVVRGIDRRRGERAFELGCRMLMLGAGAVGTTGGLLRSEDNFTGARSRQRLRRARRARARAPPVNTAHPLGGCRMADTGESTLGVVDASGESFHNANLFVLDGALVPSALGVNPSLTIAAVAESIAVRLIDGVGTRSLTERLA